MAAIVLLYDIVNSEQLVRLFGIILLVAVSFDLGGAGELGVLFGLALIPAVIIYGVFGVLFKIDPENSSNVNVILLCILALTVILFCVFYNLLR